MTTVTNRKPVTALDAFFAPRCVAVVGVSSSGRGLGASTLKTIKRFGFENQLVAINPKMDQIADVPCYPNLQAVPGQVDLALLFTSGDQIKDSILDAAAAGVKAVVVFASGFSEVAGGAEREREILDLAAEHGIRMLGPNCQGIVSGPSRLAATFSNALLADNLGATAPVAYIGQSGAIGGAVFDLSRERGCVPSVWISTGNQADLNVVEMAERVLDDDAIRVLMLYLEDVPHADEWTRLCHRAAELGKHLVLLRSGTTEVGRNAVASHTGSLVGRDEAFNLTSEMSDVITTCDVNEMVDVAMSLVRSAKSSGRRIGVVTTSGGAGGLAADLAFGVGLTMSALAPDTSAALKTLLSAFATPQNPVDVTADLVASRPGDLGQVCRIVAADPSVDQVLVILSAVVGKLAESMAQAIVDASKDADVSISVAYLSSHDRTLAVRRIFADGGITVFDSIGAALRATSRIVTAAPSDTKREAAGSSSSRATASGETLRVITEAAGTPVLSRAGISTPEGVLVTTRAEAEAAAALLGDDLVVKVQSPEILHKTELGLVVVGATAASIGPLYDGMLERASEQAPGATVEGVLIQRRATRGVELLVDVQVQDQGYPPLLTVGIGGTAVELYADVQTSLLPIDEDAARNLLQKLRGWPLLDGFRGGPIADVDAAVQAIVATAEVASAYGDDLVEFEINPLIVHAKGLGATAVDFVAYLKGDR